MALKSLRRVALFIVMWGFPICMLWGTVAAWPAILRDLGVRRVDTRAIAVASLVAPIGLILLGEIHRLLLLTFFARSNDGSEGAGDRMGLRCTTVSAALVHAPFAAIILGPLSAPLLVKSVAAPEADVVEAVVARASLSRRALMRESLKRLLMAYLAAFIAGSLVLSDIPTEIQGVLSFGVGLLFYRSFVTVRWPEWPPVLGLALWRIS